MSALAHFLGKARLHLSLLVYVNKTIVREAKRRVASLVASLRRFLILMSPLRAPERRCSSRTFRYGYLVTT